MSGGTYPIVKCSANVIAGYVYIKLQRALLLMTLAIPYSLNISREKIFADFEVFWLTLSFRLKLITCGAYVWLVFALMSSLLQYYKFIGT